MPFFLFFCFVGSSQKTSCSSSAAFHLFFFSPSTNSRCALVLLFPKQLHSRRATLERSSGAGGGSGKRARGLSRGGFDSPVARLVFLGRSLADRSSSFRRRTEKNPSTEAKVSPLELFSSDSLSEEETLLRDLRGGVAGARAREREFFFCKANERSETKQSEATLETALPPLFFPLLLSLSKQKKNRWSPLRKPTRRQSSPRNTSPSVRKRRGRDEER